MTSASAADGVPEPATRRLDPAVARGALRAGALGGGMLWVGFALLFVAVQLTLQPLQIIGDLSGGAASLLGAWLSTPIGLGLVAVAVVGVVLMVVGARLSAQLLRRAGGARPWTTTALGAVLGLVGGIVLMLAAALVAPLTWRVVSSYVGGGDAASTVRSAQEQVLPQLVMGFSAGAAILAVACTVASVLAWWLAARMLQPRG